MASLLLSQFSIRKQILMGFIPVLALLVFLVLNSYYNFRQFDSNLNNLKSINTDNLIFREVEKDVVELQRNVLVYSYVNYKGVLRKIEFLQNNLEVKFDKIKNIAKQDEEINDRFERIVDHYYSYKDGFNEAVAKKRQLEILSTENLYPLIQSISDQIKLIQENFIAKNDYQSAYDFKDIEGSFLQSSNNIIAFSKSPDSTLIVETRSLVDNIVQKSTDIKENTKNSYTSNEIDKLFEMLQEYESVYEDIIRSNQAYLYLINVVLAGKAAEMDVLSKELDDLIMKRSDFISLNIKNNIRDTQKQFTFLAVFAGLIGLLSSLLVAKGIARPVNAMASTLYKLSLRESNIEIPGQTRKDEVGQMAIAANEFKLMAQDLAYQTKELEEFSYRTSHDLRSPLISSIGLLDLAEQSIDEEDYETAKTGLSYAQESLRKLERLVQDILDLTKTKNFKEDKQKIDISQIVDQALEKLSYMDDFNRLRVEKYIEFEENIVTQKTRVVLLLENLISNAIKYQDLDKQDSFIKIKSYEQSKYVVIQVEDNGLGIPEDFQDDLFSMFKRFHPKVSFGSGLGLYMMKKSVDVLGGDIAYEDTKEGSKFTVKFPNQA